MSNSDAIPIETNIDVEANANPQPVQVIKKSKPRRIRIINTANTESSSTQNNPTGARDQSLRNNTSTTVPEQQTSSTTNRNLRTESENQQNNSGQTEGQLLSESDNQQQSTSTENSTTGRDIHKQPPLERRSLIARINGYKYKFSKFLIDYDLDDSSLNEKTIEELETLLLDVKQIVSISNATTLTDLSIKEAFPTFETIIYTEKKYKMYRYF